MINQMNTYKTSSKSIIISTLILLFGFSSCLNTEDKSDAIKNSALSEETLEKVLNLVADEQIVKDKIKLIDSLSKGKRHISLAAFIDDTLKNRYLVKVCEDNGSNLVTYYNFLVDANSMKILNEDGKLN